VDDKISKKCKKSIAIRWRKAKNLCLNCGKDVHNELCTENFDKVDTREKIIEVKEVDLDKKKKTILNYRKKKQLCINCGKEEHPNSDCLLNFVQSDNRTVEEKISDPRTIITPKSNKEIITDLKVEEHIKYDESELVSPKYSRDFILIDIRDSSKDDRVDFTVVRYLCKKFQNEIICTIGSIEETYTWTEVVQLKKMNNITEIKSILEKNIASHILHSKLFLSFPSKYTTFALENKKQVYIFKEGETVLSSDIRISNIN
jgi:hypothetical protein